MIAPRNHLRALLELRDPQPPVSVAEAARIANAAALRTARAPGPRDPNRRRSSSARSRADQGLGASRPSSPASSAPVAASTRSEERPSRHG